MTDSLVLKMTRHIRTRLLLAGWALVMLGTSFSSPADAQTYDRAGANAAIALRFSPSARAAAMGDAFAAAGEGNIEAVYYNPAGLAWPSRNEISFMYQDIVLDVGHGSLGYVSPLNQHSAWALHAQYVSYGNTQRTVVSGQGGANAGTFSGQDIALSASYGAKIGESFGYGVTAKVYSAEIAEATATAFGADLGLRWRLSESLSLGASVTNIGTALRFDQVDERLPITFRGGIAFRPFKPLLLTADVEKVAREGWAAHAGAEYTFAEILSLRAGYDGSLQIEDGLTVGAGVRTSDFDVDYAFLPFGDFGNNHRVGLRYRY